MQLLPVHSTVQWSSKLQWTIIIIKLFSWLSRTCLIIVYNTTINSKFQKCLIQEITNFYRMYTRECTYLLHRRLTSTVRYLQLFIFVNFFLCMWTPLLWNLLPKHESCLILSSNSCVYISWKFSRVNHFYTSIQQPKI